MKSKYLTNCGSSHQKKSTNGSPKSSGISSQDGITAAAHTGRYPEELKGWRVDHRQVIPAASAIGEGR